MSRVCCCSSEDCKINGCILQRAYVPNPPRMFHEEFNVVPFCGAQVRKDLTEADVRRMIQEELAKFLSKLNKEKLNG